MAYACPDCASPLSVESDPNGRILLCPSCGGRLFGLSPFERMLAEGVGARVWTGAAGGSPGGPCPYCSQPMHRPDADPDAPAGMAVCRMCQEVWAPRSVEEWIGDHRAAGVGAGPPAVAVPPADCSNCGAPFQPDEDGRCHWCHAQIAARQPLVMVMQSEPVADSGFRLL